VSEVGEFVATHQGPDAALPTWSTPDPNSASDNQLPAGLAVQVLEETTGWAHIRCDNGWEAWVDVQKLVPLAAPGFVPTHHVVSTGVDARERPDTANPVAARLDPGLAVVVINTWGDWAKVRCENDWEAWVDGRGLITGGAPAAGNPSSHSTGPQTHAQGASSPLALWLPLAGAALAILGGFLPWFSAGGESGNAWDIPFASLLDHNSTSQGVDTGAVLLVLVLAAIPLLTKHPLPRAATFALAGVAVVIGILGLMLINDLPGLSIGVGLILTIVGGVVIAAGAFVPSRA
jgi:SH3-like domain-containing protein